jgi:hypothetical protein
MLQSTRAMIGHAEEQWVKSLGVAAAWINTSYNRDTGTNPMMHRTGRPARFAYSDVLPADAIRVTPNDIANMAEAINELVRTSTAVSSTATAMEFEKDLQATPVYDVNAKVLVHYPTRENKLLDNWRGPFTVRERCSTSPSYYYVQDDGQAGASIYLVHVRRMKSYDASRSTTAIEATRNIRSTGTGLVLRVISHRRDLITGYLEFTLEFATGHISVLPWHEVRKLDLISQYVKTQKTDTRVMTAAHRALWIQGIDPATMSKAKRSPP